MVREILADLLQIAAADRASSESAFSGAQHFFEAGVPFLFFNELAAVRLRDAFTHGSGEESILLKQAQDGIPDKMLGVRAGVRGHAR